MTFSLHMLSEQRTIRDFYLYYFLFGAFGNAMVSTPLFANVGFWFRAHPGLLPPPVAPSVRGLIPTWPSCRLPSMAGAIPTQ
jgi:hypothetical protein